MSEIQTLPVWVNDEIYKVVLDFDNGSKYTALSDNDASNVLSSLDISENSAITSGNPTGIMEPNYANLKIIDFTNSLLSTNTSSPYYGYMRNGVKCTLTVSYDGGTTYEPFGIYYTENWMSDKSNGGYSEVSLSCVDNLEYIGNKELPTLPAYSGVNVVDLLRSIFTGIGLNEEDFYIEPTLSLNMIYAITKSSTVRDAINSISQALLARVYTNRAGVIQVVPSIPTKTIKYQIDDIYIESFNIQHNKVSQYNKVKLLYNKIDNRPADIILSLNNMIMVPGLNELRNLQINSNILGIDGVFITTEADEVSNLDKIEYIDYKSYQGGIDITIFSTKQESFYYNLEVAGRITGITDAFVESEITGTDVKVANTLTLENYVIQDETEARNYVNKVALYLKTLQQEVVFSGALCTKVNVQDYVHINSEDSNIDGDYLITQLNIVDGEAYSLAATAVKIKG